MEKNRILVVEDEGIVALMIQKTLEKLGYEVPVTIASGEEAINQVEEMGPHLILMDIMLAGKIDGIEAAHQILTRFDIPIIYLTAYSDDDTLQRARITKPFGYLLKPFEEKELRITIEMALYKHEMERKVKENEQWLLTTLRSIGDGVIITDALGNIAFMNSVAETLTGWQQTEIMGKALIKVFNIINEETRIPTENPVSKVLADGIIVGLANHTLLIAKDGTERPIDDSAAPIKDDKGNMTGVVLVFRDITERKQAENDLRESEKRFRQVISSISDHIYMSELTSEGDYLNHYLSPNVESLTGYPNEKFVPEWFFEPSKMIHPQDREVIAAKRTQLATGKDLELEYRMIRADGQTIWVRDSARVYNEGFSKVIYGVISDITRRRQLEEQLQQAQRMEAIGRLAGGIAHDFNNILTVIIGMGEFILTRYEGNDDLLRKDIEQIIKAGQRAALLTRQLLAFSRKQDLKLQVLDINTIVFDIKKMLQRIIGEDIELITVIGSDLGRIKADPSQLEQILMNFAGNARDAMPHGGTFTIETANVYLDEAYARRHVDITPGPYVMLAVTDTGIGMDKVTQSRIFEPFFTTKSQGKGTGLGLATIYGIVKQADGHIWVYSEPGQGTAFKIYFPQVKEQIMPITPSRTQSASPPGLETILLVEDEKMVRDLTYQVLQNIGYHVLKAENAAEALEIVTRYSGPIQILVTDVIMPGGISGRQLAEQMMLIYPKLKVLYISGYTDDAIVRHGVLDPALAFLQKPFAPQALIQKVSELLNDP